MKAALVGFLILVSASAPAAAQAKSKAGPVARARAVELYTANCQVCHGPDGAGTPLMQSSAFAGRKWKHGTDPRQIAATIADGVQGTMMLPFKGKLTSDEIAALAALVRSYDKTLKPAGAAPVKK